MCLILLAFLAGASAEAWAAKKTVRPAVAAAIDRDWQKAFALMKQKNDPVAARLLTWLYATETDLPLSAADLMAFSRQNPGWPRLKDFRKKVEENIASSSIPPAEIAAWFRQNPPLTADGIKAFMTALLSLRQEAEARTRLSEFWRTAELDKNETSLLTTVYKPYFMPGDHAARLDTLIWQGRLDEAEYMLAFVGPDTRALGHARIMLARTGGDAPQLVQAVPARLQNDEGLLFERARWRRRKNMDAGALEIINGIKSPLHHPEAWWAEQNILARRAMEKLDFDAAYKIALGRQVQSGQDYAQAEWLLGWLELRFLHAPEKAYHRFDSLYRTVQAAISRSRAAYWAARAAEALKQPQAAEAWDKVAASFISTYYGQLSYRRVYGVPDPAKYAETPPPPERVRAFDAKDLVRAVRLLKSVGLQKFADPFLARLVADAEDITDYQLAARLAHETGRDYYAVQANKDVQMKQGLYLAESGYPLLSFSPPPAPEKPLIHAIIHRESMYNPQAMSSVGALGLMQLMPGTAKAVSKRKKLAFSKDRLTADPKYNVQIGAAYFEGLMKDYEDYYPFAIAAYNAGPLNVRKWIDAFGDPARGQIPVVDWVEMISNYETRNYVQRVMESFYMYRLRLHQVPVTVEDLATKPAAKEKPAVKKD